MGRIMFNKKAKLPRDHFWVINFLKGNFLLQNLASFFVSKISCVVDHNLQKYLALKKAFYITGLEQLHGDYLEFGVYTGSAFVFSMRIHQQLGYLGEVKTNFFGFDSFQGFGDFKEEDKHPFFLSNLFTVDKQKVLRNIDKKAKNLCEHKMIEGYFDETLKGHKASEYGIGKARIVFVDCDMKGPVEDTLEFVKPILQQGTIIILDDFFAYKGDLKRGVGGAFFEFCEKNPSMVFRKLFDYGYGGVAYMLASIGEQD